MSSVTQRIKQVTQPRGGYINPKSFNMTEFNDGIKLNEAESIHAILVGLVVDYMTRYILGTDKQDVFSISLSGALLLSKYEGKDTNMKYAIKLLNDINGLGDKSISSACQLVGYDVCRRGNIMGYQPVELIKPDKNTIDNIKVMINRSLSFIEKYGPIAMDGFTFEGGYTELVTSGDGDFLTKSTLWDFKVSKNQPTKDHTLQLIMYYLMGKRSIHTEFNTIINLGIFNPRLNCVYLLDINKVDASIINEVKEKVIGVV